MIKPTHKLCRKCQQMKPVTGFYAHKRDGLQSICKMCQDRRCRKWATQNPDKIKKYQAKTRIKHREKRRIAAENYNSRPDVKLKKRSEWFLREYGISLSDVSRILVAQNGCCAICEKKFQDEEFHVDHNHQTQAIRGLLCAKCNRGLGHFLDNPTLLRTAAIYLEEHQTVGGLLGGIIGGIIKAKHG